MKLVVDSNIAISAIISPDGIIAKLLFKSLHKSQLITPSFLIEEVYNKYEKIQSITGYSGNEFELEIKSHFGCLGFCIRLFEKNNTCQRAKHLTALDNWKKKS